MADGVNPADGFVSRHDAGLCRRMGLDGARVAVADTAGIDLDTDMTCGRADQFFPPRLERSSEAT
jgi:hypothetical protein